MIIHIFASRPLNKDKNYIFIVFLSSLSPILLDSIKKQAKNASKRLKIGKSAELFPHFSQRCEFFPTPPATENVNFVHPWHLVTPRNQQLYPWTIMFWLKMLCQYSRRLVATAGNCEFLALLDEEEFSTRQT